mmetsp:Transcript_82918/g.101628  ORF Transcript_82918/g.101628 Transcript_82918/m.101628 type:complete len:242 (-) Transcript_82918:223-948(-)|eukprot:CAMPEP_0114660814 /NCGR_PEP_ID=MMETSP0191-20121206/21028_1 /TAXON_ID=126664 /ORGANISM="Sorites sp." /LENGTH=241 /DNA_ID=CAMNT_0001891021 /DNA_START=54 /DNA_END=779 /DNA_ORIENTATION=+
MSLEHQALLECILQELKFKSHHFVTAGPAGQRGAVGRVAPQRLTEPEATNAATSETASPSAASEAADLRSWATGSTAASVENSPLLQPKQLCLEADKIQLPLADLLDTPKPMVMWRVMNPNAKFKASCGFPLVSHQLSNHLLEDFRVIFAAGNTWASQNKGKKQQASSKAASKFGTLQLKFLGDEAVGDLQLYFHLGAYKLGPFRTFPERSVSELCELPVDWRRLVDKADMSLAIGVEVVA